MQSDISTNFSSLSPKGGVCIVDGYGVKISVNRRHLVVSDGIGRHRRERVFPKAYANIKRLVVVGHTGMITLEAIRWLSDVGIAFVQIDKDGNLLASSAGFSLNEAKLRRAQAMASANGVGLRISQKLIAEKLAGHLEVLEHLLNSENAKREIKKALLRVEKTSSIKALRILEAGAALAYWNTWKAVPIRFAKGDIKRLPDHWLTFGKRLSPLTRSPRLAANPINALLNYLYAIVEAETRIACLAGGLDPGLGFMHADQGSRDSLTLDVMEAIRPKVDLCVIKLLQSRTFRAADFAETRKGVCRLLSPFTHTLAETRLTWSQLAAPLVEETAKSLVDGLPIKLPTNLTQANRSSGRDGIRRKPKKSSNTALPKLKPVCQSCGGPLEKDGRLFCDACLGSEREENLKLLSILGPAKLAALMDAGKDPTHGGKAAVKRGKVVSASLEANKAWDQANERPEPAVFTREILPLIKDVPLRNLQRETGLSIRYCSFIRRGLKVPHPRHWEKFRQATQGL